MQVSGTGPFQRQKKKRCLFPVRCSRHSESNKTLTSHLHIPQYICSRCTAWLLPLASSGWAFKNVNNTASLWQPVGVGGAEAKPRPQGLQNVLAMRTLRGSQWGRAVRLRTAGCACAGARWPLAVERGVQGDGGDAAAGASSASGQQPSCRG